MRPESGSTPLPEETFRVLAGAVRNALPDAFLSPTHEVEALRRLEDRLERDSSSWWNRSSGRWALAGALGVMAVVVAGVGWKRSSYFKDSLKYTIDGSLSAGTAWIQPQRASGSAVRFSDGTEILVDQGARTRVADVNSRGAHLVLEEGRARVHVAKRPRADWTFDAGPFVVKVTGTSFDLRWSQREQRLDLRLSTGSVTVKGALAGEGVRMVAGQRLMATLHDGQIRLLPLAALATEQPLVRPLASENVPREAPPVVASITAEPHRPAHTGEAAQPPTAWARRLAAGDAAGVLREAEHRGIARVLAHAPSADLAALADAARYQHRTGVARQALLAQRKRFPGSDRSGDAAFLLGRLAEDGAHDAQQARRWYSIYLNEAADGPYAAEALGRKMMVSRHTGDPASACPSATEYMRHYPSGPYARAASSLCPPP